MMLPASMICLTSSGASSGGSAMPFAIAVASRDVGPARAALAAGARRSAAASGFGPTSVSPGSATGASATPPAAPATGSTTFGRICGQRRQIGGLLGSGGAPARGRPARPDGAQREATGGQRGHTGDEDEQYATAHQTSMASASRTASALRPEARAALGAGLGHADVDVVAVRGGPVDLLARLALLRVADAVGLEVASSRHPSTRNPRSALRRPCGGRAPAGCRPCRAPAAGGRACRRPCGRP